MSKAEEKTIELMKKAKDFIPDGGYSEKELNLAFFMFINGYHQAEKDLELGWKDMSEIVKIANLLEIEWLNSTPWDGIRDYGFYQEVLKRFNRNKK